TKHREQEIIDLMVQRAKQVQWLNTLAHLVGYNLLRSRLRDDIHSIDVCTTSALRALAKQ
ncbi:hypothetical protein LCGC14_2927100, partial [marine sediment metagenome]